MKNEKDSTITVRPGRSKGPARHAVALGRPDLQVRRGEATQRGRNLHSPRSSELSAHLADAALWRHVRRLAGREGKTFEPGKPIHLHYRVWIHAAAVDVAGLKAAYEAYLAGPRRIGSSRDQSW